MGGNNVNEGLTTAISNLRFSILLENTLVLAYVRILGLSSITFQRKLVSLLDKNNNIQ